MPSSRRVLTVALLLTIGFAIVEALAGWVSNSLALIGDAGHMLTDSMALGLGAFAAWLSTAPATSRHTFGLQRAEVLGALANVLFMYAVVAAIVVAAFGRLGSPVTVDFMAVMLVGSIGLLVNIVVAWMLHRGEQTLNTRGALLHVMGDLLGSVAAIVAGVIIWLTGWMPIDAWLSLFISVLIVVSSTRLLLETLRVLMEGAPADIDVDELVSVLEGGHPAILGVHHLHVWTVSSRTRAMSAHVRMSAMAEWQDVLGALQQLAAERFNIDHPTFQPELESDAPP